jgi:hypothetical protein
VIFQEKGKELGQISKTPRKNVRSPRIAMKWGFNHDEPVCLRVSMTPHRCRHSVIRYQFSQHLRWLHIYSG